MVLPVNTTVETFDTQTLINVGGASSTTGAVLNTAGNRYSVSGDILGGGWQNTDGAERVAFVLSVAFGGTPAAFGSVNLFTQLLSVDGTNSTPFPSDDFPHYRLGSFPINTQSTTQRVIVIATLPNTRASQVYIPAIENRTNQTISAGWQLRVTPKGFIQKT